MVLWWLCVVELFKGYALAEMWIFWDGGMRFFKYYVKKIIYFRTKTFENEIEGRKAIIENVGAR